MGVNFYVKEKCGIQPIFMRIRRVAAGIDIKVSTRLLANASDWQRGHKNAKSLESYRSRERALFGKLDEIQRVLTVLLNKGDIDGRRRIVSTRSYTRKR